MNVGQVVVEAAGVVATMHTTKQRRGSESKRKLRMQHLLHHISMQFKTNWCFIILRMETFVVPARIGVVFGFLFDVFVELNERVRTRY